MRNELAVELEERDYTKSAFSIRELQSLFEGRDPCDFLNPKSPVYKARGLAGKALSAKQALELIAEEPNLLKRPIVIAGREMIAGFDRERLRALFS